MRDGREKGRERKGGEGKRKGEEGMRGKAGHPQIFRWIDAFGTIVFAVSSFLHLVV